MKFTPTKEMISAAEAVFLTMAHEQLIRPIVEGYQRAILEKHQFHIARKWVERGDEDRVILEPKHSFLLDDKDAATYYAALHAARDAARLKVNHPENCPLLVAEHQRIKAENALLKQAATIPTLGGLANTHLMTLEQRAQAVELTLRMLAPFVRKTEAILADVMAAA